MPNLTAAQAEELAKHYSGLSLSVARYRFNNWDRLSKVKRKELSDQSRDLGKQSDEYVKMAASLIMNDVKADLAKIASVTNDIQKIIDKIASIQKVINVMAAALDLGAAIISKDPVDIVKKIEALSKSWIRAIKSIKS